MSLSDIFETETSPVGTGSLPGVAADLSGQPSFDRWSVPSLTSENKEFALLNSTEQEAFLQTLFDSARDNGYQQGYQRGASEGVQNAQANTGIALEALQSYKTQLENPLEQVDKTVVSTMAKLAVDLAEQIINSEIKQRPDLMAQQLDQALRSLSDSSVEVSARMHPQDAQYIATLLVEDNPRYQQLNIIEDENLQRGDCCLNTSFSSVESRVKEKLEQMAEQLKVLIEEESEYD